QPRHSTRHTRDSRICRPHDSVPRPRHGPPQQAHTRPMPGRRGDQYRVIVRRLEHVVPRIARQRNIGVSAGMQAEEIKPTLEKADPVVAGWLGSLGEAAMNAHDMDSAKPRGDGKLTGSADSRSRIVSDVLPLPPAHFNGEIGNTYEDSVADIITL